MQQYELTVIFKPELTEEKADTLIDTFKMKTIHRQVWGKRLLAYPIEKQKEGFYVHMVVDIMPEQAKAFERSVQLQDNIIRYLLIRSEKEIN